MERYELSLKELQNAADNGDRGRIEPLLLSVETTRLKYGAARDRLAAEMLGADMADLAPATAHRRTRDMAQLLWELSGKPNGTAENDWLRAERIVRYAGAPAE